jgi:hypothetical protein
MSIERLPSGLGSSFAARRSNARRHSSSESRYAPRRNAMRDRRRCACAVQGLPGDLAPGEHEPRADPRRLVPEPLERFREPQVGLAEVAEEVVEVTERLGDLGLFAPVVAGEGSEVKEDPFEVVGRDLGLPGGAGRLGGATVVLIRLRRHLAEEVVPPELRELEQGRVGMAAFEHLADLAVEDPKAAFGERPVDPRPVLLLDEREPLAPGPFDEDPTVDQPLDLLGERLLLHSHGAEEERELELGADGARVGDDPVLLGGERLEGAARTPFRGLPAGAWVRHDCSVSRRRELNTCRRTAAGHLASPGASARVI